MCGRLAHAAGHVLSHGVVGDGNLAVGAARQHGRLVEVVCDAGVAEGGGDAARAAALVASAIAAIGAHDMRTTLALQ